MNTVTLNFRADGQQLVRTGSEKFAANTVNYIRAVFDLGDGWDGFDSVRAVWATDFAKIATVLDSDGACAVPWEVLKRVDTVMVNLVGSIADGDVLTDRLTTYKVKALDVNGCTNIAGTETAEITPSQFEQFVEAVANEVAKIKDISDVRLNDDYTLTFIFSDETEWTTPIPIRGEQGETGNGIASAVLNADYTLTLNFTDGTHYTTPPIRGVQGETGNGIDRIEKTGTVGSVDTYTIYFTDGSTTTFTVTNGEVTKEELETLLPTESASGSIVSFQDGQSLFPMKSLKVNLEPIQDLHGYDAPWVGGAGKNKIPITCESTVKSGVTYTVYKNSSGAVTRIHAEGTSTAAHSFSVVEGYNANNPFRIKAGSYWFKGLSDGHSGVYDFNIRKLGQTKDIVQTTTKVPLVLDEDTDFQLCYLYVYAGKTLDTDIYPMVWSQSETSDEFEPYSNICPISGWDEVETYVSPTQSKEDGTTYTATLPQTVYGGTLDVVTGVLTVDRGYIASYNGETLPSTWISDRDEYASGTTPTIGAEVVYELATTQTIQLTPQEVQTLLGQNNVWSEQGDVDVTYKADIQLYIDKKTNELAVAIAAL